MSGPERRVLTLPNALTCARLLAVPVVLALLVAGSEAWAVALFVAAALTDFLDGRLARRRGVAPRGFARPSGLPPDDIGRRGRPGRKGLTPDVPGRAARRPGRPGACGGILFHGKVRVNKVGKAATALLMVAAAVEIFRPGVPGEIMFYAGIGLSLVAGLLYAPSAQNSIR